MILGDDGGIGRAKYSLTHARSHATHEDHKYNGIGKTRKHRSRTEQRHAEDDYLRSAQTVGKVSGKGHREGEEEVKTCRNQTHRNIARTQKLLDVRQHGVENLTIALIQKIGNPQQEDDLPLVEFRIYIYLHREKLFPNLQNFPFPTKYGNQ